jgi:hypothetical protein
MTTLFHKIAAAIILALSLSCTSCQQGDNVSPDETVAMPARSMREALSPNMPKTYQLVKYGTVGLSYYDDGLLKKVTFGTGYRGSQPAYIVYNHSPNKIVSKLYSSTNKLEEVINYLLDPKTGNCYESQHKEYTNPNSNQPTESTYGYYYNIKGQLMMSQNKGNVADYTLLSYDTVWNLVKVTHYGNSGNGTPAKVILESNLSYNHPAGEPLLLDLQPLDCEFAGLPDRFLRIFGKPTKYLVKLITETGSLGGRYSTYTMNADGYPTSRQIHNLNGGGLIQTIPYDYLVTNMVLSL